MRSVRPWLAAVLVVAGLVLGVIGVPALYVRSELLDREVLVTRLHRALSKAEVRRVAATQIVDGVINAGVRDLLAFRPVLVPAVEVFLDSAPFRQVLSAVARDVHDVVVSGRNESVVLDIGHGGLLLLRNLRAVSPAIAQAIPAEVDPAVLTIDGDQPGLVTVRELARLRHVGIVLPIAALVALIAGIAIAPRRRRALAWTGGGLAVVGGVIVLLGAIGRILAVRHVGTVTGLSSSEARAGLRGLWDALFSDLGTWAWGLLVSGAALAVASGLTGEADRVTAMLESRRRRLATPPSSRLTRALRGLAVATVGLLLVLAPSWTAGVAALVVGTLLAIWGVAETIATVQTSGDRPRAAGEPMSRARLLLPVGGAVLAIAASGVAAFLVTDRPTNVADAVAREQRDVCNGVRGLCALRLNEVAFPATHNSFAAADEPGWLFANQRYGIQRQLDDGIRGFLLDFHTGVNAGGGRVRTDLQTEHQDRNRVAKAIGAEGVAVAERLAGRLGRGDLTGRRELYMCHTVCELGAEPAVTELRVFTRFLQSHPRDVLVIYVEPYVPPASIQTAFRAAGLLRYTTTLERDEPLPTLEELVESGHRVVVLAEQDGGRLPWYLPAFSFSQDTPLGAKARSQFSCRRERGDADSPLFLLNHWVDDFPPPPSGNKRIGGSFLRERVATCAKERRLTPNVVAVDFYETSDVVGIARAANARAVAAEEADTAAAAR